ncbi:SAV_2336 N-terminal domain-related protein [Streptomyces sp. NPDC021093]|uniref:SAV_2336 N-terminal domain-related protein n=1 Tax=Streptomyces sp. NPDC021093 TaxID=3365112 RepID=UPI0037998E2B
MTSDRALAALAGILGEAGEVPPTGRELAELLWLARYVRPEGTAIPADPGPAPPGPAGPAPREPLAPHPSAAADSPAGPAATVPPKKPQSRVPLRTPACLPHPVPRPAPAPAVRLVEQMPLLAPAPAMLAHPLAVQRALRPLRRPVPSLYARELDEAATADRMAALAAPPERWLPVLRPKAERWLHLRLVHDSGPTMAMWRPLLRDLRTAFGQTGAFRTVDVVRLGADGRVPSRQWDRGRTAVLVVSDAMGPQWREGQAGLRWYGTLRDWAAAMPVAVVQPLPERLWRHSAFVPTAGLLAAPGPGAPNSSLAFAPYDAVPAPGIPVPVLEPSADWLGNWASLVASPGGTEVPCSAALLGPRPPTTPDDGGPALAPEDVPAEELVLRFRSLASPEAYRLASYLAVGAAHLPVMRLVQAAVEERPRPQHLAEVVLSGMLKALPGVAGGYDFRPGVRDVLLHTLPCTALARTTGLLHRVSAEIEARAGAVPGEFRALVAARGGTARAAGDPFALVSRESVRLLRGPEAAEVARTAEPSRSARPSQTERPAGTAGGTAGPSQAGEPSPREVAARVLSERYEPIELMGRGSGGHTWRAYDAWSRRDVAVKLYGPAPRTSTATALLVESAERIRHPRADSVVPVHEAFVSDGYYVTVSEYRPGPTLREAVPPGGIGTPQLYSWARTLAHGLAALHRDGIIHGNLRSTSVIVQPHHSVPSTRLPAMYDCGIRWPVPAEPARAAPSKDGDHLALGRVLYEAATGTVFGPDCPTPVALRSDLPPSLNRMIHDLCSPDAVRRERGFRELCRMGTTVEELPSRTRRWEYRVLGRPHVRVHGHEQSEVGVAHDDTLLLRLLLARGAPVSYGEVEQDRQGGLVQALQLRDLGHDVDPFLDAGTACTLDPDAVWFDLREAERLAHEARYARTRGNSARSLSLYREALALWTGEPLAGVGGSWAAEQRAALERLRSVLQEEYDRTEKSLPLRRHNRVFIQAMPLSRTDPDGAAAALLSVALQLVPRSTGVVTTSVRSPADSLSAVLEAPGSDVTRLTRWLAHTLPGLLAERSVLHAEGNVRLCVVVDQGELDQGDPDRVAPGHGEQTVGLRVLREVAAAVTSLGVANVLIALSPRAFTELPAADAQAFRKFNPPDERSPGWYRPGATAPEDVPAPRSTWLGRLTRYFRDPPDTGGIAPNNPPG